MVERPKPPNTSSARTRNRLTMVLWALASFVIVIGAFVWWENRVREPYILDVGTGPLGSDAHSLMLEVADVVERNSETIRLNVNVTSDASQNIAMLNDASIDAAVVRADTPVGNDIRVIANLYPDVMQLIARADSQIRHISDLAGARISIPPYGTDSFRSFWVLGDHYDLPIDAMDWSAERFDQGAQKLLSGDVDAVFIVRSLRDTQLIRLFEDAQLTGEALRMIAIDQAKAISVKRPFLRSVIIPAGTYTGAAIVPRRDTETSSVARILVSREDVPEDAIHELTRVLFEHRLDLTMQFSLASAVTQPGLVFGLSMPLHEGAEAFYDRDEPSFIQENAEPLALGVTVLTLFLSTMLALQSRFNSRQKNRADRYNHQLLSLQKQALLTDDIDELAGR